LRRIPLHSESSKQKNQQPIQPARILLGSHPSIPVFYDFEASGLRGFPIEIGWAWLDGSAVKSDSLLIAPAAHWDLTGRWETQAERIHGISIKQLNDEGFPPLSVAQRLNHCLAGRALYSDSRLDTGWMAQLFAATSLLPTFTVHLMPAGELVDDLRRTVGLSHRVSVQIADDVGNSFPHTHRARADAVYWAELWAAFSNAETASRSAPANELLLGPLQALGGARMNSL
jgi:hypothetical protein